MSLSREYPGFILVLEGHSAPDERSRNGGDSWTLSGERSNAVARKLVSLGMEPVFVIPESRGDTLFEGDSSTNEGRSQARQVRFRFQRAESR
jgi:flagellar motor protein MotB